ncbi:MAG: imidazole glycerol phosphate synthase subunit HisH [Rhodospirillales bacterium]|nr:imidazole glycerol phosphate synthase subunit HisH [Rhodospirillales bacterium]
MRVGIVDYGMGNLRSVAGAVEKIGHSADISDRIETLSACDKLILPGVGAFGDAMANLAARGLVDGLERLVRGEGKKLLGICLGAQLVTRRSAEFGDTNGLGWIGSDVARIDEAKGVRVPHVGWNRVRRTRESVLFDGVPDDALFYFVHSYRIDTNDTEAVVGECDYGEPFAAVLQKDNVYGTQFHPEKSQRHGLRMLANFLDRA